MKNQIVGKEFRLISGFPCLSKNLFWDFKASIACFFCIFFAAFTDLNSRGADFLTEGGAEAVGMGEVLGGYISVGEIESGKNVYRNIC